MRISDYILLVELVLSIILNVFGVYVIISSPSLRSTASNKFICLLFASHMLTSLSVGTVLFTFYACPEQVWRSIIPAREFLTGMELNFTVMLSLERYVAIQKPFLYVKLTAKHGIGAVLIFVLLITIFVCWVSVSVIGYIFGFCVTCAGCCIVVYSSYCSYRTIKKHLRGISSVTIASSTEDRQHMQATLKKRQMRSLKVCFLIAVTYLMSWVPLITFTAFKYCMQTYYGMQFSVDLINAMIIFGYTNSVMDAIIFFYVCSEARRAAVCCAAFLKKRDGENNT